MAFFAAEKISILHLPFYLKKITLFLSVALLLSACKTVEKTQRVRLKNHSAEELYQKLRDNSFQFDYFSAKAKMRFDSPKDKQNAVVEIRMKKDSVIWVSFRKMSVEGGRVLITPDSIKIIDRTNKIYVPRSFDFIRNQYGLDLDFSELQQLIAGNAIYVDNAQLAKGKSEDSYLLLAETPYLDNRIYLRADDYAMVEMKLRDKRDNRQLSVGYEKIEKVNKQLFPMLIKAAVETAEGIATIDIDYSRVEIGEVVTFSFKVNSKYEIK